MTAVWPRCATFLNAAVRDLGTLAAAASYGPFGVFGSIVEANQESPGLRSSARQPAIVVHGHPSPPRDDRTRA